MKVRSMRPPVAATVTPLPGGAARVELALPEDAIAPGQACVFYDGSRVLGGGWITGRTRRPRRDHPHRPCRMSAPRWKTCSAAPRCDGTIIAPICWPIPM